MLRLELAQLNVLAPYTIQFRGLGFWSLGLRGFGFRDYYPRRSHHDNNDGGETCMCVYSWLMALIGSTSLYA